MITPSQIYWLAKLDDIRSFFTSGFFHDTICAVLILSTIAWVVLTIVYIAAYGEVSEETSNAIRKSRNSSCVAALVAILLGTLMNLAASFAPSTKQMAAIVVIPRIANSETVSDLGDLGKDLVGLAKEWVEEMRPKPKKETK